MKGYGSGINNTSEDGNNKKVGRFSQTLDELLGLTSSAKVKEEPNKPIVMEKPAMIVPMVEISPPRPSTRHGRPKSEDDENYNGSPVTDESWKNHVDAKNRKTLQNGDHNFDSWQRPSSKESTVSSSSSSSLRNNRRLSFTIKPEPISESNNDDDDENQTPDEKKPKPSNMVKKVAEKPIKPSKPKLRSTKTAAPTPAPKKPPVPAIRTTLNQKNTASTTAKKIHSNAELSISAKRAEKSSYDAWLEAKNEKERQLRLKLKDAEEEKRKENEMRKAEALKSFEKWRQNHDDAWRKRREAEQQKTKTALEEKNAEKQRHKTEAEKAFQAWKDEQARQEKQRKERQAQNQRNMQEFMTREKKDKLTEAEKAFDAWRNIKRKMDEKALRKKRDSHERDRENARINREYKTSLSTAAYNIWLEMKEKEREDANSLAGRILHFEEEAQIRWPIPWIPPNPSAPRIFTPTGQRRTRSRPASGKSKTVIKPMGKRSQSLMSMNSRRSSKQS